MVDSGSFGFVDVVLHAYHASSLSIGVGLPMSTEGYGPDGPLGISDLVEVVDLVVDSVLVMVPEPVAVVVELP